jgi:hypothetical protein
MAIVRLKIEIEQVTDGRKYKGRLEFEGRSLLYYIQFVVPIDELDSIPKAKVDEAGAIRKLCPVEIKRGDGNLIQNNEAYGFLFNVVVVGALDFYNAPQTRSFNDDFTPIREATTVFAERVEENITVSIIRQAVEYNTSESLYEMIREAFT